MKRNLFIISFILGVFIFLMGFKNSIAQESLYVTPVKRLGEGSLSDLKYSPNGEYIAVGTSIGIEILDGRTLDRLKFFGDELNNYLAASISFSPDGRYLASGSRDKTVKLWDVSSGREIKTLTGHSDDVRSVSFSPDGSYLASGSSDKTIKLWDVSSGREIKTLTGHSNYVNSVSFSPG